MMPMFAVGFVRLYSRLVSASWQHASLNGEAGICAPPVALSSMNAPGAEEFHLI